MCMIHKGHVWEFSAFFIDFSYHRNMVEEKSKIT